jgi:hypothetical protein
MLSVSKIAQLALLLSSTVSAFPRIMRPRSIEARQANSTTAAAAPAAAPGGLTDIDILQL